MNKKSHFKLDLLGGGENGLHLIDKNAKEALLCVTSDAERKLPERYSKPILMIWEN